jgi:Ca2+-binding RTX toxin-like protein
MTARRTDRIRRSLAPLLAALGLLAWPVAAHATPSVASVVGSTIVVNANSAGADIVFEHSPAAANTLARLVPGSGGAISAGTGCSAVGTSGAVDCGDANITAIDLNGDDDKPVSFEYDNPNAGALVPVTATFGAADDGFLGGPEADTVNGHLSASGGGADTFSGGGGADTIDASFGGGADVINGGPGADVLEGGSAGSTISGGDDGDAISVTGATNALNGNAGSDTINGAGGADTINGGDGVDTIHPGAGADTVNGGAGGDLIGGGVGADDVGNDTINGGDADDSITDMYGNNLIDGGSGGDSFSTGAGNDTITADDGDDSINAGGGANVLDGGTGIDSIFSDSGNDDVTGGPGMDTINSGAGNDTIHARDQETDTVYCGGDTDTATTDEISVDVLFGCETVDATPPPPDPAPIAPIAPRAPDPVPPDLGTPSAAQVTAPNAMPLLKQTYTTKVTLHRSSSTYSGKVTASGGCAASRTVHLQIKGHGSHSYGSARTHADGSFKIKLKHRLHGTVSVAVSSTSSSAKVCSSASKSL